jgi:hypothetical protein
VPAQFVQQVHAGKTGTDDHYVDVILGHDPSPLVGPPGPTP